MPWQNFATCRKIWKCPTSTEWHIGYEHRTYDMPEKSVGEVIVLSVEIKRCDINETKAKVASKEPKKMVRTKVYRISLVRLDPFNQDLKMHYRYCMPYQLEAALIWHARVIWFIWSRWWIVCVNSRMSAIKLQPPSNNQRMCCFTRNQKIRYKQKVYRNIVGQPSPIRDCWYSFGLITPREWLTDSSNEWIPLTEWFLNKWCDSLKPQNFNFSQNNKSPAF